MSDLDQSEDTIGASETPSESAESDIEAVLNRVLAAQSADTDKRFRGFQSLMDKKFGEQSKQMLDQLKAAGLSPEQQEQWDEAATSKELEELRRYKQMQEHRKAHPDAVDFFTEVMGLESFEDQLDFIESKLGKAVAQQVQEAVEDSESETVIAAPVDANNPARKAKPLGVAGALASGEMNDAAADAILAAAGGQKGVIARLRKTAR
jgi:hypothetical protein